MVLPDPLIVFAFLFAVGLLGELLLAWRPARRSSWLVAIALLSTMLASGLAVGAWFSWLLVLFTIVSAYRAVNLLRLVEARMDRRYLAAAYRRSAARLIVGQLALLAGWLAWRQWGDAAAAGQLALIGSGLILMLAVLFLAVTLQRLWAASRRPPVTRSKGLPTVSVLIPARNETADLSACLDSLLLSDYPKLEILVLDDCSRDKTPEIIRGYASRGIRFVGGRTTPKQWLAKNYAYHQLAEEASGETLLFMGVDIRFEPRSISLLVEEFLNRKLVMMSLLPVRRGQRLPGAVVQPMRYWLELALPQKLSGHPPVLSTCWLISRRAYRRYGGMAAVARTIIAETYFARQASAAKAYRLVRSHPGYPVTTIKSVRDQIDTAVRTRYPQVKRRPERVLALALMEGLGLLLPFGVTLYGLVADIRPAIWVMMFAAALLLALSHLAITFLTNPVLWPLSTVSFPLIVFTELILLHVSLYLYEFGEVRWKGRNVCLPVMRVTAHLPPLPPPPPARSL
mgnify:CR=1 FL=1